MKFGSNDSEYGIPGFTVRLEEAEKERNDLSHRMLMISELCEELLDEQHKSVAVWQVIVQKIQNLAEGR